MPTEPCLASASGTLFDHMCKNPNADHTGSHECACGAVWQKEADDAE